MRQMITAPGQPGIAVQSSGEGRPILAVHGWLDNFLSFQRLSQSVPGRWHAMDLVGHGESERRQVATSYHFVDWIADVHRVFEGLSLTKATLVGHSLGASVCAIFAAAFAQKVEALILLEGLGPLTARPEELCVRIADAITTPVRRSRLYESEDAAVAARMSVDPSLDEESAQLLVLRNLARTEEGVVFRYDQRLRLPSPLRLSEDHVLGALKKIRCPTLIVRARSGWHMDEATMRARLDALGDATLLEVEGGHHVHLTHPQRMAPAMEDFLSRALLD